MSTNPPSHGATAATGEPRALPAWRRRWDALKRHPVFPLLVFTLLLQVAREEYPLSHYPMYSKPNRGEVRYAYLANADGKPLPLTWHTGMSPAKMSKMNGGLRLELIRAEERRSGLRSADFPGHVMDEINREAAERTLQYLRDLSVRRYRNTDRHLLGGVQYVEVSVRRVNGSVEETSSAQGELGAVE